ncbi:MAG: DUF58 domain-containing protein [Deltaproteobacteria bacterium]|nr:DUF58 domain-containing protein [Deltaproteobacteria bacterium]
MRKERSISITSIGFVVLSLSFLSLSMGFIFGNIGFLFPGAVLVSMFLLSILSGVFTLRNIRPVRKVPRNIAAFEPCLIGLGMENKSSFFTAYSLKIKDTHNGIPVDKPCYFFKINAKTTQSTYYRHAFVSRGRIKFNGVWISTVFPFNLIKISRYFPLEEQYFIFPAKEKISTSKEFHRLARKHDLDFNIMPFMPGDHPRFIHWSASAKMNRLMTRCSNRDFLQPVWLQLDNHLVPHHQGGFIRAADEFEDRVDYCSTLANQLLHSGYEVGILTRGKYLSPIAGEKNFGKIQNFLSRVEFADGHYPKVSPHELVMDMGDRNAF